jgi:hypothetical protein
MAIMVSLPYKVGGLRSGDSGSNPGAQTVRQGERKSHQVSRVVIEAGD